MAAFPWSRALARWASRCALAIGVVGVTLACSSDAHDGSGNTPGDAGSDASGGEDSQGGTGAGNGSDAGEGGSNGSDLAPGNWDSAKWNEALWQ